MLDSTDFQQHPAVGKYLMTIVIIAALCESVGIYGVVLFIIKTGTTFPATAQQYGDFVE